MIILKNIAKAPTRLQRMLLSLQSYDINIEYVSGKNLPLPDTLSRQPLPENNEILFDKQISYTRFSEPRLALIKNETKDEKQPNSYLVDPEQHSTVRRNLTDIRRDNVATLESPSITPPPVAYERPSRHRRPPNRLDL